MSDATYQKNFRFFVDHTNEKEILLSKLQEVIAKRKIDSLLDIGAGDGTMAFPLARSVTHYTAIEQNRKFILNLRAQSLETLEGTFPIPVTNTYDLVLLSHTVGLDSPLWKTALTDAWKAVAKGGLLLVITRKKEKNDWVRLLSLLGGEFLKPHHLEKDDSMREFLLQYGAVSTEKIETLVTAPTFSGIMRALAFTAGKGDARVTQKFMQASDKLRDLFKTQYKVGRGYAFPFQHYLIYCEKE